MTDNTSSSEARAAYAAQARARVQDLDSRQRQQIAYERCRVQVATDRMLRVPGRQV